MARYIDADKIPYVQSENGVLDDYAYRYDINEIPTADVVEVKHERWRVVRRFTAIGGVRFKDCECTNCGYCTNFFDEDEDDLIKFCPECGAKMEGWSDT